MTDVPSSPRKERIHLLLSAGGVRCLSYIGALMQLERENYEIASVSTASAGTVVGALYCAGVRPDAMRDAVLELDISELAGDVRWKWARRLWSLRSWPYALYREPGVGRTFAKLVRAAGGSPDITLGQLDVPLSTAAVDVAGRRLLVYSSRQHPDMQVRELLNIAVGIPLMYPPHERGGRVVLDASLASYSPVWLATGQRDDLPIVVLRTQPPAAAARADFYTWINESIRSGVVSRDTFELERLPRVRAYDVRVDVPAFKFDLSRAQVTELIEAGERAIAEPEERDPPPRMGPEALAERQAAELYRRHLDRFNAPCVFLSYAREDRAWVTRLRDQLTDLLRDTTVDVWDDSYIKPGAQWLQSIEDGIKRARVGVLLVSKAFNQSEFISDTELTLLRAEQDAGRLRLLWFSLDGSLPPDRERRLQALGDPARPLTSLGESDAARTLSEIARAIEEAFRSVTAPARS